MLGSDLIDADLKPFLPIFDAIRYDMESLATTRSQLLAMLAAATPPLPEGVTKRECFTRATAASPEVRLLVYTPDNSSGLRPALLNIHGGGYVAGLPEMQEAENARLAAQLGIVVVSPDYRLAPETRYPGSVEDCYAALDWMVANASELDLDPSRIAVGGESAGGGLAAALSLLARDRKRYKIAFQHLIYPMIDDRPHRSVQADSPVGLHVWTREASAFGWSCLLGDARGAPDVSAYAAASRASDLSGLPPAFIACGALDFFIDENLEYARRLVHAGVSTELHLYPGAPHGFTLMDGSYSCSRFRLDSTAALGRALRI
jgi:acetyl esterase/lipase